MISSRKKWLGVLGLSILGSFFSLWCYITFFQVKSDVFIQSAPHSDIVKTSYLGSKPSSFTTAAKKTLDAVVHIHCMSSRNERISVYDYFFGYQKDRKRYLSGIGSGVIITADGYIVTNNHVVNEADHIQVTLNNKKIYNAEIVGTDPRTDIALLKIKAKRLKHITFSDSDNIKVGEWVLAVGNPFNLTSTVTAGIISAKARNVPVIEGEQAINSFIQTDAVVNPGNSGGALVNTKGDLVGINTAISSHTGSYEGYSFAVPSNIAKKVVEEILEYGSVRRAYLGVQLEDITSDVIKKYRLKVDEEQRGVCAIHIMPGSAAQEAGLKDKDIILEIDGKKMNTASELIGYIASKKTNDRVMLKISRQGDIKLLEVKLKSSFAELSDLEKNIGVSLERLTKAEKSKLGINKGVRVKSVVRGIKKKSRD